MMNFEYNLKYLYNIPLSKTKFIYYFIIEKKKNIIYGKKNIFTKNINLNKLIFKST